MFFASQGLWIQLSQRGQKPLAPSKGLRIKLTLMGLKPWAESSSPSGATNRPQILLIVAPFDLAPTKGKRVGGSAYVISVSAWTSAERQRSA
jgi:hypothetical protein